MFLEPNRGPAIHAAVFSAEYFGRPEAGGTDHLRDLHGERSHAKVNRDGNQKAKGAEEQENGQEGFHEHPQIHHEESEKNESQREIAQAMQFHRSHSSLWCAPSDRSLYYKDMVPLRI
jgi:hypothetical protein